MDLGTLVDPQQGAVSASVFTDPAIYERELERIFARCWLFVAHESHIPNRGDFFASYMGEDPVIVVRQRDGSIGVYLNACRHRGMRVCRTDCGNARAFTCSYHGWTYALDGSLAGVPREEEAYQNELDKDQLGLLPVAKVASYKGLVFATFDPDAEPLEDYLGDMCFYLDTMVDRREGGTIAVPGVQKWVIPANWKFAADNFVGDGYHTATTHLSYLLATRPPHIPAEDVAFPPLMQYSVPGGHGGNVFVLPEGAPPVIGGGPAERYDAEVAKPEMADRLSPQQARLSANGNVFPNLSFSVISWNLRVWHPRGPDELEVWNWVLCDADAPPEVVQSRKESAIRTFSPAGLLEQDDGENWSQCTQATRGFIARSRLTFDYSMAAGREVDDSDLPGFVVNHESEGAQRRFYQRWLELMEDGRG